MREVIARKNYAPYNQLAGVFSKFIPFEKQKREKQEESPVKIVSITKKLKKHVKNLTKNKPFKLEGGDFNAYC